MTGVWHVICKQPIIGGLCCFMLNGLKDSETHLLVYHSVQLNIIFSARC